MNMEGPVIQQKTCEEPNEEQKNEDVSSINTKVEHSDCPVSDKSSSEVLSSESAPSEEVDIKDFITSKFEAIESLITEEKTSDERYMMRRDIIDALNSTFEDSLEKNRAEISMSTLTDVAIVREKYKELCKAVAKEKTSLSVDDVIKSFSNFAIELENILLRQNVTIFDDTGNKFDPSRNVLEKIEFSDNEQDNYIISEACSDGYSINGKIIYLQRAKVTKYQKKVE